MTIVLLWVIIELNAPRWVICLWVISAFARIIKGALEE